VLEGAKLLASLPEVVKDGSGVNLNDPLLVRAAGSALANNEPELGVVELENDLWPKIPLVAVAAADRGVSEEASGETSPKTALDPFVLGLVPWSVDPVTSPEPFLGVELEAPASDEPLTDVDIVEPVLEVDVLGEVAALLLVIDSV
jgi:hypothetical protein